MLDPRIRSLARERIEIAVEERWTPLATQTSAITSEFAKAGGFGSSRMHVHILGLYEDELDIQGSLAWGQLSTVLGIVGVGPPEQLAVDLKAFMGEIIEWIASGLFDHLKQMSPLRQERQLTVDPSDRLGKRKAHAIRKVCSEIDLFVARLEQATRVAQDGGDTHVNVYGGQIGILQTGASSTASMTVQLDSIL